MPTISNLNLTMSRDSRDVVSARVDYRLELSTFEVHANVTFHERVALIRQVEGADRWALPVIADAIPIPRPADAAGEPDLAVAVLSDGDLNAAVLGLTAAGRVNRTFTRSLNRQELQTLLEPGQDHPYVVVSAIPVDVVGDIKLAAVRTVDVGDPEIVTTVPVFGEPIGVASDGPDRHVWVVTAERYIVMFDRDGDVGTANLEVGVPGDVLFATNRFWIAYTDGNTILPFDFDRRSVPGSLTGVAEPIALAFDGTRIWVAGAVDNTIAQFRPDHAGAVLATLAHRPVALTAVTTPAGARRGFIATAEGRIYILDEAGDEVVASFNTGVDEPRGVAFNADTLVVAGLPVTRFFRIDPTTGDVTAEATVPVPSGGAAAGAASDLWIAFEPNRLVRYDGMTETQQAYEVTAAPRKVLYDGDRVFVISRTAGMLSVVRI